MIGRFASEIGFNHDGLRKIDTCANEMIWNILNNHDQSGILGFSDFIGNGFFGIELTTHMKNGGNLQHKWKQRLYALKKHSADDVFIDSSSNSHSVRVRKYLRNVRTADDSRRDEKPSIAVYHYPSKVNPRESYFIHKETSRILAGLVYAGEKNDMAAETASLVELFLYENSMKPLELILKDLKTVLRDTSDLEISLVRLDEKDREIQFAAKGSLISRLWNPYEYRWVDLVGVDGTYGRYFRMSYLWTEGSIVVMHSRKLPAAWQLSPSQRLFSSQDIAALLAGRRNAADEVTALVIR